MQQVARNLTDAEAGALQGQRYVLHDRDTKVCDSFRSMLRAEGVEPRRLPARSPNLNSFAERWVRSVKEECLSKLILVGEGSLRRALNEYIAHFHKRAEPSGEGMSCCSQSRSVLAAQPAVVLNAGNVWAACSGIMLGQHELFDSTTLGAAPTFKPMAQFCLNIHWRTYSHLATKPYTIFRTAARARPLRLTDVQSAWPHVFSFVVA